MGTRQRRVRRHVFKDVATGRFDEHMPILPSIDETSTTPDKELTLTGRDAQGRMVEFAITGKRDGFLRYTNPDGEKTSVRLSYRTEMTTHGRDRGRHTFLMQGPPRKLERPSDEVIALMMQFSDKLPNGWTLNRKPETMQLNPPQ